MYVHRLSRPTYVSGKEKKTNQMFIILSDTSFLAQGLTSLDFVQKSGWPHTHRDQPTSASRVLELNTLGLIPALLISLALYHLTSRLLISKQIIQSIVRHLEYYTKNHKIRQDKL